MGKREAEIGTAQQPPPTSTPKSASSGSWKLPSHRPPSSPRKLPKRAPGLSINRGLPPPPPLPLPKIKGQISNLAKRLDRGFVLDMGRPRAAQSMPGLRPGPGQSCANLPDNWHLSTHPGRGASGRQAEAKGWTTPRCSRVCRLCQGQRCNKGLSLLHSRFLPQGTEPARLHGDSESAH